MKLLDDRITPHFRLSEFACDGSMLVTAEFIIFITQVLEPFRVWYNRVMNINRNGGFRTPAVNDSVGGVPRSLHLRAMAVDVNLPGDYLKSSPARQKEFCKNVRKKWNSLCRAAGGYGQICWYDGFMHLGMSWEREYFEDKRGVKKWKI